MKIEKVNDQQIRCTLTKDDLANRELKISELAYGSEKAKSLFRDMMEQASSEFGFEAEDIPLMIEAIPMNAESLVLIITKVEDPEELDTRFSKFAPSVHSLDSSSDPVSEPTIGADEVVDLYNKLKALSEKVESGTEVVPKKNDTFPKKIGTNKIPVNVADSLKRLYFFSDLENIIQVAKVLNGYYKGNNTLYKDPIKNTFILLVEKSSHTPQAFNKTCNILSEYGRMKRPTPGEVAYLNEHSRILIKKDALRDLLLLDH